MLLRILLQPLQCSALRLADSSQVHAPNLACRPRSAVNLVEHVYRNQFSPGKLRVAEAVRLLARPGCAHSPCITPSLQQMESLRSARELVNAVLKRESSWRGGTECCGRLRRQAFWQPLA
jgi:hypothetical protein